MRILLHFQDWIDVRFEIPFLKKNKIKWGDTHTCRDIGIDKNPAACEEADGGTRAAKTRKSPIDTRSSLDWLSFIFLSGIVQPIYILVNTSKQWQPVEMTKRRKNNLVTCPHVS